MSSSVSRDEFGIPLGKHRATCGCQLEGRSIIKPCSKHRAELNLEAMRVSVDPKPSRRPRRRR